MVVSTPQNGGWIGVDIDGTVFRYTGWTKWCEFGEPIFPMVQRILVWYEQRIPVKAVTARIGLPSRIDEFGGVHYNKSRINTCKLTGERYSDQDMHDAIMNHFNFWGVPIVGAQCFKDYNMIELWDDRAVQVVANTGRTLAEEHEAILQAERGKQYGVSQ